MGRSIQTTWDSIEKMTWGQFTEDREIVFSIPAGWNARESREDSVRCHAQIVNSVPPGWKRIGEIDGYVIYRHPGSIFDPHGYVAISANTLDGGPGSGNFGHAGRPGEVGGSAPDEGSGSEETAEEHEERKKYHSVSQERERQRLAQERKKAVKGFEDEIRNRPTEKGIIYDDSGRVVFSKVGSKDAVSYPIEKLRAREFENMHLTHNHPNGSTFSDVDVKFAVSNGLRSIRACYAGGAEMLTRKYDLHDDVPAHYRAFGSMYGIAMEGAKQVFIMNLIQSGRDRTMSTRQINKAYGKYINERSRDWLEENAESYGWRYEVETI